MEIEISKSNPILFLFLLEETFWNKFGVYLTLWFKIV